MAVSSDRRRDYWLKKYYWNRGEEAKLLDLWRKGITDFNVLGIQLGRTPGAVEKKVDHLSLGAGPRTTTTVSFTEGLLSCERATLFSCLRIVDFQFIDY